MKFVEYNILHLNDCLRLFDLNCPEFFAPNERNDYEAFLDSSHKGYQVGTIEDKVVAAEINTIPDGWGPGMHRVNMEWVV